MSTHTIKKDLLVIGELNMDLILNGVASLPELGKEKTADDLHLSLGSSSAIFAANSSRLGLAVLFCGMIGPDDFGAAAKSYLTEYGVDTSLIKTSKKYKTGLTVIMRQADDRAMITYPGAMEHFTGKDIPDHAFDEARHLHISSIFLQRGIKKDLFSLVEKAKLRGMTVSVDPQWDPAEKWGLDIKRLLKTIDFFLPNEREFLHLSAAATVEEGLRKCKPSMQGGNIIVKRGEKGAAFWQDHRICTLPAFKNDRVVDTIGAGDSFNAGFIFRFLQGDSIGECVKFGTLTGAVSTTQAGGTTAITGLEEVLAIAKNKLNYRGQ